jgi:hypothetical protein
MNLPGFTAEAALDKTSGHYQHERRYAGGPDNATVVPQRIKLTTVRCACDAATDICVCDNGRVLDLLLGDIR